MKEEAQLEADLKECIQYDAEMEISGKIVDIERKKEISMNLFLKTIKRLKELTVI